MNDHQQLIRKLDNIPLSEVIYHSDVPFIDRLSSAGFPYHFAVHKINEATPLPKDYTEVHWHPEEEINIIFSESTLKYKIVLGEEEFIIDYDCAIHIPSNLPHASNVVEGSGYFVVIRI